MIKGIVGIECGSRISVISKIGRHGLENIASETSNREIPCIIVYGDKQRLFAELAQDRLKSFWQQGIAYPFRLCTNNEINKGFTFFNYNQETKKAIIDGQELELVQLIASYFTYLDNLIYKNLNEQDNYACAISTPNYFTLEEKLRLQTSAQIARLPCLKIVEEHCAIGYTYLWFQKQTLHEKRKRVLFVDLGQSQTSCFIYDFDKLTARAQYLNSNRDLGVRNIDKLVYQYLQEKHPDVFQKINKKQELRVIDQIEKLRKVLSSNSEANLMIECLTTDHDLQHNFTREEFEQILYKGGFVSSFEEILNRSISFCLQYEFIVDDIEIIGGGTRIPLVQSLVKKIFNKEKLGISMQTSENISRGCAIACALAASQINPLIKIEHYKLQNILQHDVQVELFVQGQKYAEQKFSSTQFLPTYQQISAILPSYVENMDIQLRFNNVIYKNTESVSGNNITISYTIGDNGILEVKQASVGLLSQNESQNPDNQMVDEEDYQKNQQNQQEQSPQQNQMEIEQEQKYFDMDLFNQEHSEELIQAMIQEENKFRERDQNVLLAQEQRNYLEQYINDAIRFTDEQLKLHFSADRLAVLYQILRENKEFVDNNEVIELKETESRIQLIKNTYEPFKNEYKNQQQQKLPIKSLDELKNISTLYTGKTIQDIQLLLNNQNIGDGGGLMGYFKSSGSQKIKEYLSSFGITRSVLLELGNNSFTDLGVKNILKALSLKSLGLKEFSLNLESNLKSKNKNTITAKSIQKVIKLISKLQDLEILEICVNQIEENELQNLQIILLQKQKLKQVKLVIRNYEQNKINRDQFINQVKKVCGSVLVDCYNETGMKVH
ncbi:hypothetical protein ABPG72_000657 [Tetrahymena utriculariae]